MRDKLADLTRRIDELKSERAALNVEYLKSVEDFGVASKTAEQLQDESTAEIEAQLERIEAVNAKVRDNQRRADAEREAEELAEQYDDMTERIEAVRASKMALLDGADLPLPGLVVENGLLAYEGRRWDCMSGSEPVSYTHLFKNHVFSSWAVSARTPMMSCSLNPYGYCCLP